MPETNDPTPARRGRPELSEGQRNQMRQQIADVALRLFQEEGYGQVSVRRIAREIGCSPMTLYKYYDAKIDILRTLWADVLSDVFDQIDQLEFGDAGPAERLQAAASAYVGYWLNHTEHYRLVFMAEGVTQPEVGLFVDNPDAFARYQVFASAITEAYAGDLQPDQLKAKIDTLLCFMHGIAHNLITISGYQWTGEDDMIAAAVRAVTE